MDPKNTIRTNLNRRTKIVDGKPDFKLGVPLPPLHNAHPVGILSTLPDHIIIPPFVIV